MYIWIFGGTDLEHADIAVYIYIESMKWNVEININLMPTVIFKP